MAVLIFLPSANACKSSSAHEENYTDHTYLDVILSNKAVHIPILSFNGTSARERKEEITKHIDYTLICI